MWSDKSDMEMQSIAAIVWTDLHAIKSKQYYSNGEEKSDSRNI